MAVRFIYLVACSDSKEIRNVLMLLVGDTYSEGFCFQLCLYQHKEHYFFISIETILFKTTSHNAR